MGINVRWEKLVVGVRDGERGGGTAICSSRTEIFFCDGVVPVGVGDAGRTVMG